MKTASMAFLLAAGLSGTAAAGDLRHADRYESGDFAARAYWRMDFGGAVPAGQGLGLRLDSERGYAAGAPATLQLQFGQDTVQALAINGVDLRRNLAAAQNEGGIGAFFSSRSSAQLVAVGVGVVATTAIAVNASNDDDEEPEATGSSSE